jgi:hypothetical protein
MQWIKNFRVTKPSEVHNPLRPLFWSIGSLNVFDAVYSLVINPEAISSFVACGLLPCCEDRRRVYQLLYTFAWQWLLCNITLLIILTLTAATDGFWQCSVRFDNTWYEDFASLYFDIWKLVAKQKVGFLPKYTQMLFFPFVPALYAYNHRCISFFNVP